MRPIINQAFIDGMSGTGDPNVHAARLEATLQWFIYLSVYKEAYTCTSTPKDCDSSWAYYTGGSQVDGALQGMSKFVAAYSPLTNQRIFDGVLAVRCFRDLYPGDMYPTYADLPAEGQQLFDMGWEQLDNALHRGFAVVLRQHVAAQDSCGGASAANWRLVQIMGNAIVRETKERDGAMGSELETLVNLDEPSADDTARIIEILDAVFPCP